MQTTPRIIISGGGTGGHIFPAIAIANAIKELVPTAQINFVGAEGRMEMTRVPEAGYPIEGLPVAGFNRANLFKNIAVIAKLLKSLRMARRIIAKHQPHVVVGVGGYASGPTLWAATQAHIPTLIQEQNSYAGVTNKLLAKRAKTICVAYQGMERFFPQEKIQLTGNPVRQSLLTSEATPQEARAHFQLNPHKPTLLIIGGSLGARTINQSISQALAQIGSDNELQLLWQTGKGFDAQAQEEIAALGVRNVVQMPFISQMELAYRAADVVISRAGASSISELSLLEKAVILVPSPNVAEDHQTKNAEALASRGAALLIADKDAKAELVARAIALLKDSEQQAAMKKSIALLAQQNSARRIAQEVLKLGGIRYTETKE